MRLFRLTGELVFPHPSLAWDDGLLAVGGDLSMERLLLAYANGIFPWYDEHSPILWWSPDPRQVLFPESFRVQASLRPLIRNARVEVTADTAFGEVMHACARVPRRDQPGTWILPEMIAAYSRLHREGYAHSVEVWHEGELAGGLYGVSLGGAFFGESMFYRRRDASKLALYHLSGYCMTAGIRLIDTQVHTSHLERLGAVMLPREEFLKRLEEALRLPGKVGSWTETFRQHMEDHRGRQ